MNLLRLEESYVTVKHSSSSTQGVRASELHTLHDMLILKIGRLTGSVLLVAQVAIVHRRNRSFWESIL